MYSSEEAIETLVRAFEACTLPRSGWTHAAHLTVAAWYLWHHPKDVAIEGIRSGIQRYNVSQGIAMTPTGGYHETLTLFWITLADRFLAQHRHEAASFTAVVNAFVQAYENQRDIALQYYTAERLFSWEARCHFTPPDKMSLEIGL